MVRALRIPTEADDPITEIEVSKLEDYQAAVGGWIEPVDIAELGVTIYVHEEGLVLNLPVNSRATFLWWYFVPEARQKAVLVGPAVVVGLPNRNGDSTPVPDEVVRLLTGPGEWRVDIRVRDDPTWHPSLATYTDYFEALVWSMVALERVRDAENVRVVSAGSGSERTESSASDPTDREPPPAA